MKEYFLKLYSYNAWSNEKVLQCLRRQQVNDDKVLSLMGHIVAAQFVWLYRIKVLPPPEVKLWGKYTLAELSVMTRQIDEQWMDFLENNDNFSLELTYTNTAGEPYVNNVEMIMIHVANHATYHRGQIALLLRQKGFEPVSTDFITYDRVIRGQIKE